MTPTLLFVDDEEILGILFRMGLKQAGLTVVTAKSGEEALEMLQADTAHSIRVVFTDINMGAVSGWELIDRCRVLRKDLRYMVITAEPDNAKLGQSLVASGKLFAYFDKSLSNRQEIFDKCKEAMTA